jgi:hypothetical protein
MLGAILFAVIMLGLTGLVNYCIFENERIDTMVTPNTEEDKKLVERIINGTNSVHSLAALFNDLVKRDDTNKLLPEFWCQLAANACSLLETLLNKLAKHFIR